MLVLVLLASRKKPAVLKHLSLQALWSWMERTRLASLWSLGYAEPCKNKNRVYGRGTFLTLLHLTRSKVPHFSTTPEDSQCLVTLLHSGGTASPRRPPHPLLPPSHRSLVACSASAGAGLGPRLGRCLGRIPSSPAIRRRTSACT